MKRERLTPDRIRRFSCPDGVKQAFLWDTDAPRLAVRATVGAKSFIFESKLNRRTIRVTIGDVNTWPLTSTWEGTGEHRQELQRGAREEANRLQSLIDQGVDPREQKAEHIAASEARREKLRRTEAPAMEAWKGYIEARQNKWSKRHLSDHLSFSDPGGRPRKDKSGAATLQGILYPLLQLPLTKIDDNLVREWLKSQAGARPTRAALGFRLLRAFLNWCSDRSEYREQAKATTCTGRLLRDELPRPTAKDDCLQREQLHAWFSAVRNMSSPIASTYLQGLLLTGARREELAGLRWSDVDFQWHSLTIRDKVDGERVIPLTPYFTSLLLKLKSINDAPPPIILHIHNNKPAPVWTSSPWVFSSPVTKSGTRSKSGRIADARGPHERVLKAAGLPPLSIHGLRRSFGTLSEWIECPVGVVAQIMGHKPSALAEKHYRRRPLDLLRMWHTRIETWILGEAGITPPTSDTKSAPKLVTSN